MDRCQSVAADTTATDYLVGTGPRGLAAAVLTAGAGAAATASAVDAAGNRVFSLAAVQGTSATFVPSRPATFKDKLTVTIAGAGATLTLYEA